MKDEFEIMSIDEGMQIDRRDEQPSNAEGRSRERFEPGSNVTLKSFSQTPKQSSEIVTMEEGIQIDRSDEQ
jgi:hypothetical protein